jgi:hypothetical protein
MSTTTLDMWVIYKQPRDYPDGYVARRWIIGAKPGEPVPTEEFATAPTLEEIRKHVPGYCVRLERDPRDEPQIVECWI